MSKKQETAVDWLWEEINKRKCWTDPIACANLFIEASKLNKEQHEKTYFYSTSQFSNEAYMPNVKLFEQYYKETYGQ